MKKFKTLAIMCALSLMICGFSTTAYADGGEFAEPPSTTTTEEAVIEPAPLTPDGNLTLVDDIDGEQAENKQFVTMQSKNGNYFYLVIDRDGEKENVYFLNLVDEADLLALIEEPPVETAPEPTPPPVEEEKEPVVEEQPKETSSNSMAILGLFLILGLAGGGAFYYFKVLKPKQDTKGTSTLDDYDFDEEDDEELILDELSEEEFEDEKESK
ncbi:MAG: DUF4366 domain-containing protein [Phocaeicola sp.]